MYGARVHVSVPAFGAKMSGHVGGMISVKWGERMVTRG